MVVQNYYKTITLSLGMLLGFTTVLGMVLASSRVMAEDTSVVDEINITVPISCTMSGTGMNSHNAEIANGAYTPDIGSTTLHAFCNDNEGFAIYAAGYTGNEVGGTNSDKLVGTSASGNAVIESGLATTAGNPDVSNWAMKLAISQDSGDTTGTNAFTIDSAPNVALPSEADPSATSASFSQYHIVPNEYVKVAHKNSGTDMTATTGGVKLTTTYAAYISKTQPADTYSGQVIYTLVHPSSAVAGKLNVNFDGNGLTFPNGKATNLVAYEAIETETTGEVTKVSRNVYTEEGEYGGYSAMSGNDVVTIDGAESLHITVTYGVPQNTGGPPSDLYIWAGNHPDYTNANNTTSLTSCGSTTATDGAFKSSGSAGSQVTMECDITGDSVTFYDYSQYDVSTGYYASVTGQGIITSYEKTAASGTYQTPAGRAGQDVFLGWSTNPNANADAEEPLYTNEADFIANAPYTNIDNTVTLYAVWGKTFNAAYADANKSQLSGHYKMQDGTEDICKEIYVGATETLIDSRDNTTYMAGRLKDGKCWMLDNLALDPTNSTTAANMNASNTNATQEAITNLLNGGSSTTGWSSVAVENKTTGWNTTSPNNAYEHPYINNVSKNTLVTSYGPASTNGQAKVGIYYNFCAASASTYCYASGSGVDAPDTIIDASQDICPANWRMPTGGNTGEYYKLAQKYGSDATNTNSLQYNLSTPLSGGYYGSAASFQGSYGYWWSSTYYDSFYVYGLSVNPTSVYPNYSGYRIYGRSVRCLMAD